MYGSIGSVTLLFTTPSSHAVIYLCLVYTHTHLEGSSPASVTPLGSKGRPIPGTLGMSAGSVMVEAGTANSRVFSASRFAMRSSSCFRPLVRRRSCVWVRVDTRAGSKKEGGDADYSPSQNRRTLSLPISTAQVDHLPIIPRPAHQGPVRLPRHCVPVRRHLHHLLVAPPAPPPHRGRGRGGGI